MPNSNLPMPLPLTEFIISKAAVPKARLILAHGAGAGADSNFMQILAEQLSLHGVEVWRFNFAYMQRFIASGKRALPDKMPQLITQFLTHIAACEADLPLFIGGKSMGGRVASMLCTVLPVPFAAAFAFGYPFHAAKKTSWRTEHFASLACPLFIIQGERDAFGSKTELDDKSWPGTELYWLADADHDFKPRVKSGFNQQQLIVAAAKFCSRKIDEVLLANQ